MPSAQNPDFGKPITEIASHLGLDSTDLIPYGHTKAKVKLDVLRLPGLPKKSQAENIRVTHGRIEGMK
ncbi:MAG: formate--tetrahydrofolate ligase [Nitrospinae bacterium]|nr:formate--tetrahydrofolate ligase [Nitrospinota bacterium]